MLLPVQLKVCWLPALMVTDPRERVYHGLPVPLLDVFRAPLRVAVGVAQRRRRRADAEATHRAVGAHRGRGVHRVDGDVDRGIGRAAKPVIDRDGE